MSTPSDDHKARLTESPGLARLRRRRKEREARTKSLAQSRPDIPNLTSLANEIADLKSRVAALETKLAGQS
jgi:hypothetical protein